MPCFHPLKGWRSKSVNPTGKRSIVFKRNQGLVDMPIDVPCGQCSGCRLERSRQWAIRCCHEASLYQDNCFLTLTYNDDHLPVGGTLVKSDFQKFMKRLRKKFGGGIRYYYCGEYGEKLGRPHYHAILFNFDFADKVKFKYNNGNPLYKSETLDRLWPHGFASIGAVTFDSAAYVARYVMKKMTGKGALEENEIGLTHYDKLDTDTGEVISLQPEYTDMSRNPGVGKPWLDKFEKDVYPCDDVIINGLKLRPPKYYDNLFEGNHPDEFKKIKAKRKIKALENPEEKTIARLRVKEQVLEAKLKRLFRPVEKEM